MSDDRRHAITIITFLGSVFSPYYAWSGRRDPLNHVAINVALYGERGHRWAMTERGTSALQRDARTLRIGPSGLAWDGSSLVIDIDEWSVPMPRRIRGRVRIRPKGLNTRVFALDAKGRHHWHPVAPSADIEVELDDPALAWRGTGYFDINRGEEPLEAGFQRWHWSRAELAGGSAVLYDMTLPDGSAHALALRFDHGGEFEELEGPAPAPLPSTLWRIGRRTRADLAARPRVMATLEDTPFYARSMLATRLFGEDTTAMHESLALDRFSSPVVRAMLPFRMPRRARWTQR